MPAISVIVPVYNVEQFLPRCVDSILGQSFTDFELILVDDGSPDNCGAICDSYVSKDSRVHVIHQENKGVSEARNTGMKLAQGEWLAMIDSDDWIHREYLRLLYEAAETDTDVVICGFLVTQRDMEFDQEIEGICFHDACLSDIEPNRVARTSVCGRLLRRSSLRDITFIPGIDLAEDSCFNELLFRQDMKFKITDAKLYYYYMRQESAIHNNRGRGTLSSIEQFLQRLPEIDEQEKRRRLIMRCYKNVLFARYLEMFAPDYQVVKERCHSLLRTLKPYKKELDMKDRIIYSVLSASPQAYRLWRILQDPTMLAFEKDQKRKRALSQDDSQVRG